MYLIFLQLTNIRMSDLDRNIFATNACICIINALNALLKVLSLNKTYVCNTICVIIYSMSPKVHNISTILSHFVRAKTCFFPDMLPIGMITLGCWNVFHHTGYWYMSPVDSPHCGPLQESCEVLFVFNVDKLLNNHSICRGSETSNAYVTSGHVTSRHVLVRGLGCTYQSRLIYL